MSFKLIPALIPLLTQEGDQFTAKYQTLDKTKGNLIFQNDVVQTVLIDTFNADLVDVQSAKLVFDAEGKFLSMLDVVNKIQPKTSTPSRTTGCKMREEINR